MPIYPFPRSARIRKNFEFERVYAENAYAADKALVIQACLNHTNQSRLGLSVSRRVGNAVVRNRWKRLIREAFRVNRSKLPASLDLVVRPRKGATANYAAIAKSLVALASRLKKRLEKTAP